MRDASRSNTAIRCSRRFRASTSSSARTRWTSFRISSKRAAVAGFRKRRGITKVFFEFENIAPVGDEAPMSWKDVRASGFVPVTRGCDMGCTFCIVPQTRGKEVSRPMDDIVAEVRALVDAGIRDVTLLGQIVNRYGRNLDGKVVFHELIDRLADVPGLYRLRFTSSHPVYLTKALVDCFAKHGVLAPHVHLPVQTASNRLLKEMRRGYTIELYEEKVSALREARDDMAVSTDIIVGYPGETEEDFRDTLEMVERIRFDGLFAFNYSPRPGTPAIGAGDPVPEEEKANRLDAVLQASQRITEEKNRAMVGQVRDVLIEGDGKGAGARFGRTACHRIVHVHAPDAGPGDVLRVKIERGRPNSLSGRVVTNQV
ncbi:MAG: MiaB/RimO family radical SAM methylthiotransferase [Deltaproteobacteria bacterium]|nr:MiaB/RimO family radical SAM methylthiotransferase [Deltaproteobacteria bacterium]